MTRKTYTPEEKESALRLAKEIGFSRASKQTGVAASTLYKWHSGLEDGADTIPLIPYEAAKEDVLEDLVASPFHGHNTPGKRYTAEEKENALRLCKELGLTKTSKKTGISVASLRNWRVDARREKATTRKAAQAQQEEVASEETYPHPFHENAEMDTTDTSACAPIELMTREETVSRMNDMGAIAVESVSEELIRLRIENDVLKTQVLTLKGALRAFTE